MNEKIPTLNWVLAHPPQLGATVSKGGGLDDSSVRETDIAIYCWKEYELLQPFQRAVWQFKLNKKILYPMASIRLHCISIRETNP